MNTALRQHHRRFGLGFTMLGATLLAGCAAQPAAPRPPVADNPAASAMEDEFERGANRKPTVETYYAMSKLYTRQGKDAEAESVLKKVVRGNPKFTHAYNDLAEVQLRQRRVDDAVATLRSGLAFAPRDAVMLNNLGMCLVIKHDYEHALKAFIDAIAARPDDARFRSNAAMALGMLGRYDESISLYVQTIPEADAHYNLGVICESRGDTQRAAEEFRKAEALKNGRADAADSEAPTEAVAATDAPETK
jgi:Flp pilus assembly protein TadD